MIFPTIVTVVVWIFWIRDQTHPPSGKWRIFRWHNARANGIRAAIIPFEWTPGRVSHVYIDDLHKLF